MSTSLVPAVTDALVAIITAALPAALVVDGPLINDPEIGSDYVSIGADPSGETGASASQDWAQLGRGQIEESFDILGYLYTSTGDNDSSSVKVARDHAYALLALVESAVRADPTLGAVIPAGWARLGAYTGQPLQGPGGYAYGITFHITGNGRI